MKKFAVMLLCAMTILSVSAQEKAAEKTPADIAKLSFSSLQTGDLKSVLPYVIGSQRAQAESTVKLLDAIEKKDLNGVLKNSLIISGQQHDDKTVNNMATFIRMQNKENQVFIETRKKFEEGLSKWKKAKLGEVTETITGDTAKVVVNYTQADGTAESFTNFFTKVDGKWFNIAEKELPKKAEEKK